MMKRPSGLGRGLGALIPPRPGGSSVAQTVEPHAPPHAEIQGGFMEIPVEHIVPNPKQPRQHFDHAALEDLTNSIREHGVVEPLIVTRLPDGNFELIAGERRLRAATIAGLATVPCVIRTASEQDKLELALIENIQRHDLNPIEEAIAYQRLMDEFGLTQDDVGKKVGKSRPQVGNTVRLLQLPREIQQALVDRKISASNARTLLSLPTDAERMRLFEDMLAGQFTVRQTEARIPHPRRGRISQDPNIAAAEQRVRDWVGHRVHIKTAGDGAGEIRIYFHDQEDLEDLLGKIGGSS
ncbi:ParB/RepB/Spo0J family partition protein [candidate division WWE3 bacterium]|uniref:ParB/RepB/Spo0J family partition protein n=1 Tax=candidate division WWE3 bacterium TaxID=2053526 RepID=A0A928TPZ3_UNCKA|nr:ParB/RepB/Spo0J family partition protein [candidate division WWE3 bacterium]